MSSRASARFRASSRKCSRTCQTSDPIWISTAVEENAGNIDLIEKYARCGKFPLARRGKPNTTPWPRPPQSLARFSPRGCRTRSRTAVESHLAHGKNSTIRNSCWWMETPVTPAKCWPAPSRTCSPCARKCLQIALPLHAQMYPDHNNHSNLGETRPAKIWSSKKCCRKYQTTTPAAISCNQPSRRTSSASPNSSAKSKSSRLKLARQFESDPTPPFERGIYSVAGFHSAPPLEPQAEAQYWGHSY